jgi:CheY-like chemotaxis protein
MARILIVEDEEQVRVLVDSCLREEGHSTLTAGTSDEALAVMQYVQGLDLMIADINLLGDVHGGLTLAQQCVEKRPNLKVLYTSGRPSTDGMNALMVEGSAVLEKPFTIDQLTTCLIVHFGINKAS